MGEQTVTVRGVRQLDHDPAALRWARKQAGQTQAWLAAELGISPGHMSEIESGKRNATPANIRKIAKLLGCPRSVIEAKQPVAA